MFREGAVPAGVRVAAWLLRLFVFPFGFAVGLAVPVLPGLILLNAATVDAPERYGYAALLLLVAAVLVLIALLLARLWWLSDLWLSVHAAPDPASAAGIQQLHRGWRLDAWDSVVTTGLVLSAAFLVGTVAGVWLLRSPVLGAESLAWGLAGVALLRMRARIRSQGVDMNDESPAEPAGLSERSGAKQR